MNARPNTLIIRNREGFQLPADGWYQIERAGEWDNEIEFPGGKKQAIVERIDAEALASWVNRFQAEARAENFAGILIDQEHFSHDRDKATDALGWLMNVATRADGAELWGQIRWTGSGEPKVSDGTLRFFSTEPDPHGAARLGNTADGRPILRPLRLAGLSLTNRPRHTGGRPITNRQDSGVHNQPTETNKTMKTVTQALGLADDASEESIAAAIGQLKNRADKNAALKTENAALKNRLVESDLVSFADVIGEETAEKEAWKEALIANRDNAVARLTGLRTRLAKPDDKPKGAIHNRAAAGQPAGVAQGEGAGATAISSAEAAKIRNRADEIEKAERIGWGAAFDRAQAEFVTKN